MILTLIMKLEKILKSGLIEAAAGLGALTLHQSKIFELMDKAGIYDKMAHYQANPPMPPEVFNEYFNIIAIESAAGFSLLATTAYLTNRLLKYIIKKAS